MDDLKHIGEIPCARNSLLAGIASGFGIGVIRGINTSAFFVCFFRISFKAWRFGYMSSVPYPKDICQLFKAHIYPHSCTMIYRANVHDLLLEPFVAANWAVGTFLVVSVGTW